MAHIEIVRGSLLDQEVELIVNAANTSMRGGSGIDGAIHRAAGPELVLELMRVAPGGCKPGQVVVSGGHRTRFKHIIHTPGPVWQGGNAGEEETLIKCYVNSINKAIDLETRSIGFCSISTGIYGFPLDRAAPIAMSAVRTSVQSSPITRVVFAMFREDEYQAFLDAYDKALP